MKQSLTALITIGILIICSCKDENRGYPKSDSVLQSNTNSDERVKMATLSLQTLIKENANSYLRFTSFRKTNGVEEEFLGIKMYTLEWLATVETTHEIWGRRNMLEFDFEDDLFFYLEKPDDWSLIPEVEKLYFQPNKTLRLTGETGFEMTDNGWRISMTSIEFTDKSDKYENSEGYEMKINIGK